VFLRLSGRRVVVVGGGGVAESKLQGLIAAGAAVTVVAPDIRPGIASIEVTIVQRRFEPSDLDGAAYVVAASLPEVNRQVALAAEARHLFVNAVDDFPSASAFLGGVVRRDGITLAISTNGLAPALAGLLREGLDALLPSDLLDWVTTARDLRAGWKSGGTAMGARRPELLTALNRLYADKPIGEKL